MSRSRKSVAPWTTQTLAVRLRPAPWSSCTSTVEPEEVSPPKTRAVMAELMTVHGREISRDAGRIRRISFALPGRNRWKASPVSRPVASCTGR